MKMFDPQKVFEEREALLKALRELLDANWEYRNTRENSRQKFARVKRVEDRAERLIHQIRADNAVVSDDPKTNKEMRNENRTDSDLPVR